MPVPLLIMAKAPVLGQVKTRLCPPLSPEMALRLYTCFLGDKVAQIHALPGALPGVAYTPADARAQFRALVPEEFLLLPQRGGDLGERLCHAFDDLLADGHAGALLIDSDSPTLPTSYLEQALAAMKRPEVDLVLGPCDDGGYYLVGLRGPRPELFEGIAWSTPAVMPQTLAKAKGLGLTVYLLPEWYDVDTAEDLRRLESALAVLDDGRATRHTREFFRG